MEFDERTVEQAPDVAPVPTQVASVITTLKNMMSSIISLIGATGVAFIVSWLLARQLGEAQYGEYVFMLSIAGLIMGFADLGQAKVLTREVAKNRDDAGKYLMTTLVVRFVALVVLTIVGIGVIFATEQLAETRELAVIVLLMAALMGSSDMIRALFNAFERMEFDLITRITEHGTTLAIIVVILLTLGLTLDNAVVGLFIGATIGFLVTLTFALWRFVPLTNLQFDGAVARYSLRAGLSMGLSVFIFSFYARLDTLLLGLLRSTDEVAWFSIAYSLTLLISSLSFAGTSVLYPVFSRMAAGEKDESSFDVIRQLLRYSIVIGTIVGAGLFTISEWAILFVYGEDYAPAISALRILSISLVVIFPVQLLLNLLLAENKQNIVLGVHVIGAVLLLFIDPPMIAMMGIDGAAWTNVIVEALMLGCFLYIIHRSLGKISLMSLVLPSIAGVIGFGLLIVLPLPMIPRAIVAFAIYMAVIFATRVLTRDDIAQLRDMVRQFTTPKAIEETH